jgi:hypothetical protein
MSPKEISRLRVKNLVNHRVVNQTRMGKIQSLYFLTIAGNENGMLGIGEGKAAEDEDGRRQAMMNAIRNMRPVPRYEERTIYGDVQAKVGASVVQLSARSPGMLQHNFQSTKRKRTRILTTAPQASATAANTSSTNSPAPPASQISPRAPLAQETR